MSKKSVRPKTDKKRQRANVDAGGLMGDGGRVRAFLHRLPLRATRTRRFALRSKPMLTDESRQISGRRQTDVKKREKLELSSRRRFVRRSIVAENNRVMAAGAAFEL